MRKGDEYELKEELVRCRMIIDRFVRSCSHGLRGPLCTIEGLAEVASHTSGDELNNILNLIKCRAKSTKEMLRNLEAYITHSQREMNCDELDAGGMIGIVLNQYEPVIKETDLQVITSIDQSHSWVSDHECNFLILKNVIGNAIQFADHKKEVKQIDINARSSINGLVINIRDNGIGIIREAKKSICQPFFRGSLFIRGWPGIISREDVDGKTWC